MSSVLEFLVISADMQADGCFSAEVTKLIKSAAKLGGPELDLRSQAVVWRSALGYGVLDDAVADVCGEYRRELVQGLWCVLDGSPGASIASAARLYASALEEHECHRLIEQFEKQCGNLPQEGAPGHAALCVLLALDHPAALDVLQRRAPPNCRLIPCGAFTFGGGLKADERPAVRRWLPSFYLARYPVTVRDVRLFASATGAIDPIPPSAEPDWPAHQVSCAYGAALAVWMGGRLPLEPEWEKAARGAAGYRFPWGEKFEPDRANTLESGIGRFTAVDLYEDSGCSGYGVADMVGNAWEWTSSRYAPYGGDLIRGADPRPLDETVDCVLRGGAYDFDQHGCNCLNRYRCHPERAWDTHGVRMARGL